MIRQAYPTDTPAALLRSELDFYADGGFTYPMWKWALMQRATSMPVYFYQFGRTLPPMPGQLYKGLPRAELGAFHGDEVAYAFGTLNSAFGAMDQLSRKNRWERVDHDLSAAMVGYWANFVKSGDPNGRGLPVWPPYESISGDPLMRFYGQPRATPDERTSRMKLLDAALQAEPQVNAPVLPKAWLRNIDRSNYEEPSRFQSGVVGRLFCGRERRHELGTQTGRGVERVCPGECRWRWRVLFGRITYELMASFWPTAHAIQNMRAMPA